MSVLMFVNLPVEELCLSVHMYGKYRYGLKILNSVNRNQIYFDFELGDQAESSASLPILFV